MGRAKPATVTSASLEANGSLEAIGHQAKVLMNLISSISTLKPSRQGRLGYREICSDELRLILKARRLRANFISDVKFAEPAWDMLLDLFASQLDGQLISASSLGLAAGVPVSTAMRHIEQLCAIGVLSREADPYDRRRSLVRLSSECESQMNRYFVAMSRLDLPIG